MLIKFMPQDTSENPQSVSQNVTVHLNRVISDHLNDFLATFIDKGYNTSYGEYIR